MTKPPTADDLDDLASPHGLAWASAGVAAGAVLALVVLPHVVPAIFAALSGPQPKAWWYLSRASGLVAFALVSTSMILGLLLSTKLAKGSAAVFSLHEHASILGVAFATFHAIVLLGDLHTPFTVAQIALPFGATYRPIGLGIGQLAVYGMALLVGSFYVRTRIGKRTWRVLHFTSFVVFTLVMGHALAVGSDRGLVVAGLLPAAAVLFFGVYRTLVHLVGQPLDFRRGAR